jgi:hypothetical protein
MPKTTPLQPFTVKGLRGLEIRKAQKVKVFALMEVKEICGKSQ